MNKTALTLLLALTPAALYIVFALFNPLPPLSALYVATVNSFTSSIMAPVQGLFSNPAVLATASGTASGLVVNYVRGKMQQTVEAQSKAIIGDKDQQITELYQTLGANGEKINNLEKEANKVSALKTKVTEQQQTITQYEELIQRKTFEKAGLDKKEKDEIAQKVLEEIRKP